ncbi:MAG: NAD(P)-dependent oxidoreductase [Patescibacteria group bacterium]|nr:NAD(P)-dependent oxidoreductase [Patescibacteria group bacterium]
MKIVVTQKFKLSEESIKKLKAIGEVKFYNDLSKTPEEWFERCKDADIICTGKFGFKSEKIYELENKFISVPFVGTGFLDLERLNKKNITVSRSPGCNRIAVSEWIVGMMFNLLREFPKYINVTNLSQGDIPSSISGLAGKKVTVLGNGNVGHRVGKLCQSLDMSVEFFDKGDDLKKSVIDADVTVNTLNLNPTTNNLLNKDFFESLKRGSFFITVTSSKIYNIEAMIGALNKNILAGAADDLAGMQIGDIHDSLYRRLAEHPKILVTPHISYKTDNSDVNCSKMMVDNVEDWAKGKPVNIIE